MSSSGLKTIHPVKYDIHIICRFQGDVVLCKTIDNAIAKLKCSDDLYDYLANDPDFINRELFVNSFELDEFYLARIIANYSKKYNNGFIDWRFPYRDLSFAKMRNLVDFLPIAIVANVHPDGIGGIGSYPAGKIFKGVVGWLFSNFDKMIDWFKKIYSYFSIKKHTYEFFEDNYGVSKNFIHNVIKHEYSWKEGFIDSNYYSNKYIYEKKIMKDCGYILNRKNKEWRKMP